MLLVFKYCYKKRVIAIVGGFLLLLLINYLEHTGLVLAPEEPWEIVIFSDLEDVAMAETLDEPKETEKQTIEQAVETVSHTINQTEQLEETVEEESSVSVPLEPSVSVWEPPISIMEPVVQEELEEESEPIPPMKNEPILYRQVLLLRGEPIYYENIGSTGGQAFIDNNRHMATTYFGNTHYRASNHTSTHFAGHNQSTFGTLLSMTIGERFEIYDDLGQKATYTITDQRVVPIVSQMEYETYEYLDRIGDKKRVVLQTCTDHTARNALLTEGISTH